MRLSCITLLCAVLPLLPDIASASSAWVRGIDPELASHYAGDFFTCLDGSSAVPASAVNDDYCDCLDGSDEPGTAACANGFFYCQNQGFHSKSLPSYFVDDGICDCCDGSDEKNGHCENGCFALGEELREKLKQKQSVYATALKEKSSRLEGTETIAEGWKKELKLCLEEIDRQKERCDAVQEDLDALQEEERKQKELEEQAKQEEAMNASSGEKTQNDPVDPQNAETDDPEKPNEKEDATNDEELSGREDDDTEADVDDDTEAEAEGEYAEEDDPKDLQDVNDDGDADGEEMEEDSDEGEDEDQAEVDVSATEEEEEAAEEEHPSLLKRMKQRVTSLFSKKKSKKKDVQRSPGNRQVRAQTEDSDFTKLRREHNKEQRELRNLEEKRDALQSKIDRDYGPESKFISLADKCFELKQDKYTYEICPFDKANQKERHRSVNLGKFERLGELYNWMEFLHGQSCSHGKSRSLRVHFHCGQEDGIDSVTEPDMCEYLADFSTPMACSEAEFELLKQEADSLGLPVKDEL